MGHPKDLMEVENVDTDEFPAHQESAGDKFLWTYTSPEFPMAQVSSYMGFIHIVQILVLLLVKYRHD